MKTKMMEDEETHRAKLLKTIGLHPGKTSEAIHSRVCGGSKYGLDATFRRLEEMRYERLIRYRDGGYWLADAPVQAETPPTVPDAQEAPPDATPGPSEWSALRSAVLAYLADGPMTAAEIAKALGEDTRRVGTALGVLSKAGQVRKDGVRWTIGATDATIKAEFDPPLTCDAPVPDHWRPEAPWKPDGYPVFRCTPEPPLAPEHQIAALTVALERQKEETAHAVADACEQARLLALERAASAHLRRFHGILEGVIQRQGVAAISALIAEIWNLTKD